MTGHTPEGFEIQACRSCSAPIVWASTSSGKVMPVDAEPTDVGNVELIATRFGGAVASVLTGPTLLGGPLRTSHFATCPEADKWRQR